MINNCVNFIFWAFGVFFVYLLFIQRLKITFKNSIYKISNCVDRLLFILLTIFLSNTIIYASILQFFTTEKQYIFWASLVLISGECIHIIIYHVVYFICLHQF